MNPKAERSIKVPLYHGLVLTVAVCLCVSLFYFSRSTMQQFNHMMENDNDSLREAASQLDYTLNALRESSEKLTVNNIQFRWLSQKNCTDQQRTIAERTLKEFIEILTPASGISLLYDADSDDAIFYYGSKLKNPAGFLENVSFMHHLGDIIADTKGYHYNQWFLFQDDNRNLLMLVNKNRDLYFCVMVDLDRYFELNPVDAYSDLGTLLAYYDDTVLICPEGKELTRDNSGAPKLCGHTISYVTLSCCPLHLALVTPKTAILANQLPSLLVFLVVVIFLLTFLRRVMRYLDQSLLFPLQEIAAQMALLSGIQTPQVKTISGDYREYAAIRTALEELVQQKNALEAQNYANREQKEHALLQYYQLQTRSHFFINCLKSLYSMAENSNRMQMQSMIIAFSNHLRYIFHDNLNLVSLQSELNEVMDYHRIINLDSSMPFILTQNVPKELLDTLVPPLIIQTFLENTYKYADRNRGFLAFHIEASEVTYHDVPYLRLHLFDNGCGYAEDVLESINDNHPDVFADYHVGINNLRHRMMLIYGDSCKTAFYNEENNGAHSVLYIPIQKQAE